MSAHPSVALQSDVVSRLLESLSTAVVLLGPGLRLLHMNPAAEMLFGVSARQQVGHPVSTFAGFSPRLTQELERCASRGHPFTEHEVQLEAHDGRPVTVDIAASLLQVAETQVGLILELRQVDRHLRIAREEQLQAQFEAARQLLRGLAHEVKNPLGGIRGAAQLLEREFPSEELTEYTAIIIREADRLRKLVDRLLGPNDLPRTCEVNVHEILEQVCSLMQAEAGSEVSFVRDYDPSIPMLSADPDQLVQAVLNVVRNAVQALEGRGVVTLRTRIERQLTIGQRRNRLAVCLDVLDNGPGIPREMIERIFMPMITDRPTGTGLGLSIAQNLVRQHRGMIECRSHPGETLFRILLPLEDEHGR